MFCFGKMSRVMQPLYRVSCYRAPMYKHFYWILQVYLAIPGLSFHSHPSSQFFPQSQFYGLCTRFLFLGGAHYKKTPPLTVASKILNLFYAPRSPSPSPRVNLFALPYGVHSIEAKTSAASTNLGNVMAYPRTRGLPEGWFYGLATRQMELQVYNRKKRG